MQLAGFLGLLCLYLHQLAHGELLGQPYYAETLHESMNLLVDSERNLLLPFNRTRIPGSKGSEDVQDFIRGYFKNLTQNWHEEVHSFNENGYNFTNLVYTLGEANNYLVLAAHYDSMILKGAEFIGATDSAVPCAILLYVAGFMDSILKDHQENCGLGLVDKRFTGLKIVFFDGEEAIQQWSPTDSLYGSRRIAEKWEQEGMLEEFDLFVLLDLLGSAEQIEVPSYFRKSHHHYRRLSQLEKSYNKAYGSQTYFFKPLRVRWLRIADDHLPFLERGVNVLHLITFPFPKVWHKVEDNFQNLDQNVINKWTVLICEFVLSYYNVL